MYTKHNTNIKIIGTLKYNIGYENYYVENKIDKKITFYKKLHTVRTN